MRNAFQLTVAALGLSLPARTFLFVERVDSKEVEEPKLEQITLPKVIEGFDVKVSASEDYYFEQQINEPLINFHRCESRLEGGEYTSKCCGTLTVAFREMRNKSPPKPETSASVCRILAGVFLFKYYSKNKSPYISPTPINATTI